jgi:hypothetical protein
VALLRDTADAGHWAVVSCAREFVDGPLRGHQAVGALRKVLDGLPGVTDRPPSDVDGPPSDTDGPPSDTDGPPSDTDVPSNNIDRQTLPHINSSALGKNGNPRGTQGAQYTRAGGLVPDSGVAHNTGAGARHGEVPPSGASHHSPSISSPVDLARVEIPASEVVRGAGLGDGGQGGVCEARWQGDVHALKVFKLAPPPTPRGVRGRGRGRGGVPSSSRAPPPADSDPDTAALAIPAGALRELAALKALMSPYVVRLYGVVQFPLLREVGVLMDHCDGGSLRDLIEERVYEATAEGQEALPLPLLDGESAAQLVRDAAFGLKAVHGARIIHSDLKSPNVLLVEDPRRPSGWKALIGDFGWSQVVRSSRGALTPSKTEGASGGTEHWMAPEQIAAQKLTSAADMYSLGCVIWELATGLVPWSDPETGVPLKTAQVIHKVITEGERLAFPPECSSGGDPLWIELVAIARECFEKDPTKRPTAEAVAARLGDA